VPSHSTFGILRAYLLRLIAMCLLVTGLFYVVYRFFSEITFPDFALPACFVVLGISFLSHRRIFSIPKDKKDLFVQAVMLSMVVRLLVFGGFALLMLWFSPERAMVNILYFLSLYLGATSIDFHAVYVRNLKQ
jgi:hypothetical protein